MLFVRLGPNFSLCFSPFELLSSLPIPEVLSILHVATKFMFDSVRIKVLSTLDSAALNPWQQYAIAVDHSVEEWLLPSYVKICDLIEAPSTTEVHEFSRRKELDDYIRLSAVREDYRARLILYALASSQIHPYTSATSDSEPSIFAGCEQSKSCRTRIKSVLNVLFNNGQHYPFPATPGGNPPKTILELVLKATRQKAEPSSYRFCNACCEKGGKLIANALGHKQLKAELKRSLQI